MSRKCSNWLSTYIKYTTFQEAPKKMHTWVGLSLLASTVQRNIYLDRGYFSIYPNLYVAIVAPTGFSKSSAANIGIKLLDQLKGIELMKEKLTSWFLLDYFDKLTKSKGECCVTIYAPEMRNFLGDLNKTETVTLLTSFFECPDSPAYRTKGGGVLKFKNVCINLLACSTPEWLTLGTTTDEIAGGFTGRFVYVYEDSTTRSFPFPEDFVTSDILDLRDDLLYDLEHIRTLKGKFVITDQAKAEYMLWYSQRKKECTDERLVGYYERKRDLIFKVAMLLSVSQDDSLVIDEDILHETWDLLLELELKMTGAFAGVVDDPALKYRDLVISAIAREPTLELTRSEILRKNCNRFDVIILDRIVNNLLESKIIKAFVVTKGGDREVVYRLIDARRY